MDSKYLDMLMNDHAIIEKALILLEKETEKGDDLSPLMAGTLLEFLHNYGELCHNAKEEQAYFPLLLERGIPPQGPIGIMLQEHEMEKNFIAKLSDLVDSIEETGVVPSEFKKTVDEFLEVTKNHIWKENDILYPMGKRVISAADETMLENEFLRIEKETVGVGGYTRYLTLINTLELQTGKKINLLEAMPHDILNNMLDRLPVELSFVDKDDRVRYFNKLNEKKIFARSLSVIGRTVQQCHPEKSVHMVNKIIEEMKDGKREDAAFWIHMDNMLLYIAYYAVRGENGEYQGVVEMVQDVQPFRDLQGDKRLMD